MPRSKDRRTGTRPRPELMRWDSSRKSRPTSAHASNRSELVADRVSGMAFTTGQPDLRGARLRPMAGRLEPFTVEADPDARMDDDRRATCSRRGHRCGSNRGRRARLVLVERGGDRRLPERVLRSASCCHRFGRRAPPESTGLVETPPRYIGTTAQATGGPGTGKIVLVTHLDGPTPTRS